jgi:hypothetical protein
LGVKAHVASIESLWKPRLQAVGVSGTTYVFHPFLRVEFHAEWLRDEPFDATTTGQNTVPVSTLSWNGASRQGT